MTFRALALGHSDVAKDNPNGNLAGKTTPPSLEIVKKPIVLKRRLIQQNMFRILRTELVLARLL